VGGPDAGAVRALTAGSHTVGRAGADVTVADPTLSRVHLRLDVGADGMTVTDLGSENGTRLDGTRIEGTTALPPGARIRAGRSTLVVRPSRLRPATTSAPGDGTLRVSRSPRPIGHPPTVRIDLPRPPQAPETRRPPWLAALIPLPIAGVLAWLFGPHLLLLAAMSPLMLIGSYVSDRVGSRRMYARARQEHRRTVADCERQQVEAVAAERAWRERIYPDPATIARLAGTPSTGLWGRTGTDGVVLRLGSGTVTGAVIRSEDGATAPVPIPDAPVTIDLAIIGSLDLTGALAARCADALIGQLVTLHSPEDVCVWTDRTRWRAAPHVRPAPSADLLRAALAELRRRQSVADTAGSGPAPAIVVVCTDAGADSEAMAALDAIARDGAASRMFLIVHGAGSPAATTHLATAATGRAVLTERDGTRSVVDVDAVGWAWSHRVAGALTPLRDSTTPEADLPATVTLAAVTREVHGDLSASAVADRWARADDGAWLTLGRSADGPHRIDLSAAGPHALVGGTTGSGKSELLRTLVASLASEHPPDDLAVVLVDYKGGSAFTGLESLPHIVGVVTDLDTTLTARALTSLRAEVRRREELFARCGANDIIAYRAQRRRSPETLPHLARLVIVVDEFRALADDLPDFVTGLVRLAAVGRSLGIHLVLATQRPAGVVTADMRANLGLRIALRMRDRGDSQDVIESDAAALLPRSASGRALLRSGAEPITAVQTALLHGGRDDAAVTVQAHWRDGTITERVFPLATAAADDDLVDAVVQAADTTGRPPPPSPWLPPLPDHLTWTPTFPPQAWALADDPASQTQEPVRVQIDSLPHTAIAGGIGSGRTSTALALVTGVVAGCGERTHVYVLADGTGPLGALADLPHTGAVIDRTDPATIAWFTDRLAAAVRTRRSEPVREHLLVVIDGWDILADACDSLDHGALTDRLLATLREGYAVGVRSIVTGDRSVVTGRVGRTLPHRLLLRPADPSDLALAGLRPDSAPTEWPPGRLLRVDDGAQLQVLRRDPAGVAVPPPRTGPWTVLTLPARIRIDEVHPPTRQTLTIGVSGDPDRGVDLGGPGRRRLVVLGSPGSGRSTALAALTHQAARAGRSVAVVGDPHAPLGRLTRGLGDDVHHLSWQDDERLVALRRDHPDIVVVADDIDRHLDSLLVPILEQIADLAERDGGLIAVTGDGATIGLRARGVGAAVLRGRTGIVLGAPTALDGDALGVRLPRVRTVIPGRGWFVTDRTVTPVQVALPAPVDMTGVTAMS
ncbi:MAG TPA: FHA domain-containing protein, partial [Intrasporangiaceae bacterium]|nr:FHA domain-containing protein [Intrasporangiaceae bacterium]